MMIMNITGVTEGPMWANSLGIIIGCLLGILIPKLLVSNSNQIGLNKVSSK